METTPQTGRESPRLIGTVGIYRIDDQLCELRKMYLHPEWRGQGLGKVLLERGLQKARDLGFRRIELETAHVMKEAIALYRKYGFTAIHREEIEPQCDFAMGRDL